MAAEQQASDCSGHHRAREPDFPHDTAREMRNVHLFFVKQFGCLIVEGGISIDLAQISHRE
jgi:hypothetical protein